MAQCQKNRPTNFIFVSALTTQDAENPKPRDRTSFAIDRAGRGQGAAVGETLPPRDANAVDAYPLNDLCAHIRTQGTAD